MNHNLSKSMTGAIVVAGILVFCTAMAHAGQYRNSKRATRAYRPHSSRAGAVAVGQSYRVARRATGRRAKPARYGAKWYVKPGARFAVAPCGTRLMLPHGKVAYRSHHHGRARIVHRHSSPYAHIARRGKRRHRGYVAYKPHGPHPHYAVTRRTKRGRWRALRNSHQKHGKRAYRGNSYSSRGRALKGRRPHKAAAHRHVPKAIRRGRAVDGRRAARRWVR